MIKRFTLAVTLLGYMAAVSPVHAQAVNTFLTIDSAAVLARATPIALPVQNLKPAQRTLMAIVPSAVMLTYGALSFNVGAIRNVDNGIRANRMQNMAHFNTDVDDIMQYTPAVAALTISMINVKGKHSVGDRTGMFLVTEGLMASSVYFLKKAGNRQRPNAANNMSFPSGHTANAFAAAEFIRMEYGQRSSWYGIAGYAVATATGVCRIYNNAHWFSDVMAGAGLGILSAKAGTVVYPFIKNHLFKKQDNIVLTPQIGGGYAGMAFVMQL